MTTCPSCGSPAEAEDRFCGTCGTRLGTEAPAEVSASRFCTNCGGQLEDTDRFCGRCGAPVRTAIAEGEPATADAVNDDDRDFFADWNLMFAEEPPPTPEAAVTEAIPRPRTPATGASETAILPEAPTEPPPAPAPAPPRLGRPSPRGFPWGATAALAGAVAVIVSAILPWVRTGAGELPRDIPARTLLDPNGPGSGLNLGVVLLVVGTVGALVALFTMVVPWLGFLRRLAGLATLAIPVLFVVRVWQVGTGLGDLGALLGAGVYAAGAGALAQIVAGKWFRR